MSQSPVTRKVSLGPRSVVAERDARERWLLRSPAPLGPYPARLTERLLQWAMLDTPESERSWASCSDLISDPARLGWQWVKQ